MRIAVVSETFAPQVNGVVTTLRQMLNHLRARGHEALVFAPNGAPESYAGYEIVPLHGWPLPIYSELKLTPPQPGLTAHLRRFRPDVLYFAGLAALAPTAAFVTGHLRIPAIAAYHTDWPAYSSHYGMGWLRNLSYAYLRMLHNRCALTLCPSTATLSDLRSHGFKRLRIWGRGVDTERFNPQFRSESWRASIGAKPGETVLLYVGRLAAEKRLDVLADSLRGMQHVRMVFVGDGPARSQLEHRLAGAPVSFLGYLQGEALSTAYASADLFAFPSDSETFGQVIQEAMASGLPVVAARAGGAIDLVREGSTGLLTTPGNVSEFRYALQQLMDDSVRRMQMGQAGYVAAQRRSWATVMDELLEHCTRAASPRPRMLMAQRRQIG